MNNEQEIIAWLQAQKPAEVDSISVSSTGYFYVFRDIYTGSGPTIEAAMKDLPKPASLREKAEKLLAMATELEKQTT